MRLSPILVFHICAGTVGLFSGAAAMFFRKGSQQHRMAGNVFVISMLSLSASGAYLGFMKHQMLNSLMGVLTFYLVATAWWTARRGDGKAGIFDLGALMVSLATGAGFVTYGLEAANGPAGVKDGYPAGAYFIFGSLALLFASGDVRMLVRGGISGAHRIARHLLRMCSALFIAAGSLFLGQQQVFPSALRKMWVLSAPVILIILLTIFWMVRVLFTKRAVGVNLRSGNRKQALGGVGGA